MALAICAEFNCQDNDGGVCQSKRPCINKPCNTCKFGNNKTVGGWIPVSERLPEEHVPVMASTKLSVFPEARYSKKYGCWEWAYASGDDDWRILNNIVTAWMPLPEPYNGESE